MDMVRDLDDISFTEWFTQLGGSRGSLDRMWDPIAYALGFVDCDHISARCMLTIFMLFAIRTEASVLRMLEGSPQTCLHDPILKYLGDRGVKVNTSTGCREILYDTDEETGKPSRVTGIKVGPKEELREFDAVVCALDVPGIKKVLPQAFRDGFPMFDNIYNLDTVPIATVQVRFDGWVTEMNDAERMKDGAGGPTTSSTPPTPSSPASRTSHSPPPASTTRRARAASSRPSLTSAPSAAPTTKSSRTASTSSTISSPQAES